MANKRGSSKTRSWVAEYWKVGYGMMIGGVKRSKSSRWGLRADAEDRLASVIDINASTGREVEGRVLASSNYPEIFPHCPGSLAQVIGGHCFVCKKKLTVADAREYGR